MPFRLTPGQLAFVETFGYLSFPGLLQDRLQAIDQAFEEIMAVKGGPDHQGLQRLAVAPFLNHHPYLCSLLDDGYIAGIAESLMGPDYQYWNSDGNYYVGDTPWHSDTAWPEPIRFYKMAVYLDPLRADTGALRVIPGSHHFGEGFAESVHAQLTTNKESWGGLKGSEVPALALETEPGDLVLFNHSTKHSAWGGSGKRRMFTIVFTPKHTGTGVDHFKEIVRSHRYTTREVFGIPEGPLLATASPERLRHLAQLLEHVPAA